MCHDVGRSAPAVAGLAPVQCKEHRGTATTNTAHRSSPLPVQGVKRCAQQNDYRGYCVVFQLEQRLLAYKANLSFLPRHQCRGFQKGPMVNPLGV